MLKILAFLVINLTAIEAFFAIILDHYLHMYKQHPIF